MMASKTPSDKESARSAPVNKQVVKKRWQRLLSPSDDDDDGTPLLKKAVHQSRRRRSAAAAADTAAGHRNGGVEHENEVEFYDTPTSTGEFFLNFLMLAHAVIRSHWLSIFLYMFLGRSKKLCCNFFIDPENFFHERLQTFPCKKKILSLEYIHAR